MPNPAGKDRQGSHPPSNDQLNREWMEFSNVGSASASIEGVAVSHYTFDRICQRTGEDLLMTFKGGLQAGHSVRLHSGTGTVWNDGAVRHLYIGRGNYAWNNSCGDTAVLRNARGEVLDYASYDPNPPEGVVLNRVPGTHKLSGIRSARSA